MGLSLPKSNLIFLKKCLDKWVHFILTYAQIEELAGVPIDHSFLKFKKELLDYGYQVGKISMKEEIVAFEKVKVE